LPGAPRARQPEPGGAGALQPGRRPAQLLPLVRGRQLRRLARSVRHRAVLARARHTRRGGSVSLSAPARQPTRRRRGSAAAPLRLCCIGSSRTIRRHAARRVLRPRQPATQSTQETMTSPSLHELWRAPAAAAAPFCAALFCCLGFLAPALRAQTPSPAPPHAPPAGAAPAPAPAPATAPPAPPAAPAP